MADPARPPAASRRGADPVTELLTVAAPRDLTSAHDQAAVIDSRIEDTGLVGAAATRQRTTTPHEQQRSRPRWAPPLTLDPSRRKPPRITTTDLSAWMVEQLSQASPDLLRQMVQTFAEALSPKLREPGSPLVPRSGCLLTVRPGPGHQARTAETPMLSTTPTHKIVSATASQSVVRDSPIGERHKPRWLPPPAGLDS
jgi:hypothetical protein